MLSSPDTVMASGSENQISSVLQNLTQFVNLFQGGERLQKVQLSRIEAGWVFFCDFWPRPGAFVISLDPHARTPRIEAGARPPAADNHPLGLFLKAHAVGQRVKRMEATATGGARMHLGPSGNSWELELRDGKLLATVLRAEEPKPYRQTLVLAPWAAEAPVSKFKDSAPAQSEVGEGAEPSLPETPEQRKARRKQEKLLANVRADAEEARDWLARFAPVLARIVAEPRAWASSEAWEPAERALLEAEILAQRLPPFGAAHLGAAQKNLFDLRRRLERKSRLATERLAKLERSGAPRPRAPVRPSAVTAKPGPARSRKKPGLWVEVAPDLWARLGRSATENDELFRQARDRDLWFHVRGQTGAHVWIPRGQPALGSKDDAPENVVRLGCQLALINSRASQSGSAFVDYTERRYLKKISGTEGALRIVRSEARDTRLDEELERRLMKKG